MNNAKISPSSKQQQQQQEIRQSYMAVPETVPDVAAEMNKWFADADRYGFLEDKTEIDPKSIQKEVERSSKWHAMAEPFPAGQEILHRFNLHNTKFVKRVYKGIPDCWRRDAWYCMLTDELSTANKDDLLRRRYKEFLTQSSSHERQIDLDIPRTMYGHIMFRQRYGQGQRALFNVLRAFSIYDDPVGYCQGMANVVAILLIYFEEEVGLAIMW
ncbi:RabGAP/TBC [Lichtheimia hyalospora FSU 10163]|nr:RabGAP/TBC [Lichtheimia hyalospora FSU 10163]